MNKPILTYNDIYELMFFLKFKVHCEYITELRITELQWLLKHYNDIDELRSIVCETLPTYYVYEIARDIDRCFHWETYQKVLGTCWESYYAVNVLSLGDSCI